MDTSALNKAVATAQADFTTFQTSFTAFVATAGGSQDTPQQIADVAAAVAFLQSLDTQLKAMSAQISGTAPLSITSPTLTVSSGANLQFASNVPATWSASAGTIDTTGLFVAPTVTSSTTVSITATSIATPSQSASAMVTVNP